MQKIRRKRNLKASQYVNNLIRTFSETKIRACVLQENYQNLVSTMTDNFKLMA